MATRHGRPEQKLHRLADLPTVEELWQRLLGWPASESGSLCRGDRAQGRVTAVGGCPSVAYARGRRPGAVIPERRSRRTQ
jgi:hypothetical protein